MRTNHNSVWADPGTSSDLIRDEHRQARRYPLWMWWNLLSLDAPTVVCLWALLFMHAFSIRFRFLEVMVLAATVWIIYAGDRTLDGLRTAHKAALCDRHNFYARHAYAVLGLLLPMASATLWISFMKLNSRTRTAGLVLCAAVIFYFLFIHLAPAFVVRWFPKEFVAGAIFAAGAAIPAWTEAAGSRKALIPAVLLFAGVCGLNCVVIECWEHHRGGRQWEKTPYWLIRLADTRIVQASAFLIVCAGFIGIIGRHAAGQTEVLCASGVSLLLIAALDRQSDGLSPQALRVLADVTLLTPAVFLLKLLF